jgi:hypothetical protein
VLFDSLGDFDAAYRASVADMDEALAGGDFRRAVSARSEGSRPDFSAVELAQ